MRFVAVAAVASLVALAGSARADITGSQIDIKIRPWGSSAAWSDNLALVSPNLTDPLEIEVGVFYHRSEGYGLSTVIHNIVGSPYSAAQGDLATILDRPDSTQHPDGRLGNFNFGGQHQVVYHTGTVGVDANRFRIADRGNPTDNAAGGISIKQNTPVAMGTNFDTANDTFAYHFKLSLACYNGGAARTVTIDAPKAKAPYMSVYDTASSTTVHVISSSLIDSDPASVTVSWIPAPSSVLLVAGGMTAAGRRRR